MRACFAGGAAGLAGKKFEFDFTLIRLPRTITGRVQAYIYRHTYIHTSTHTHIYIHRYRLHIGCAWLSFCVCKALGICLGLLGASNVDDTSSVGWRDEKGERKRDPVRLETNATIHQYSCKIVKQAKWGYVASKRKRLSTKVKV